MRAGPSTTTQRPRKQQRLRLLSAGAIAILASGLITVAAGRAADAAPVGAGSYTETLPAGRALPSGCGTISSNPREFLTANAPAGAVPTNDWWSSLVFKRSDCAYSLPLHAHPISYDTFAGGLGFSYTTTPTISGTPTTVGRASRPR